MISCIIGVMNREKALQQMLPSWTDIDEIKDFVIVDWSSSKPIIENSIIQEQIKKYGNIKVIRVENQKYFYRCLAWNLAFQNTDPKNKILLKLDADYISINSKWIDKLELDQNNTLKNYFIAGYPSGHQLFGFLLVNKINFGKGYNENMDAVWGFEDSDLYSRINQKEHIEHIMFSDMKNYIIHIPHSQRERTENLKYAKITKRNQYIGDNFKDWESSEYKILEDCGNYKRVELIKKLY